MWIATQHGFFSIVKRTSGRFHVRARCRGDLESLITLTGLKAQKHHTRDGDYAWRIVVGQDDLNTIMAAFATSVDYPNFKSHLHGLPDQQDKIPIYSRFWMQMLSYQKEKEAA